MNQKISENFRPPKRVYRDISQKYCSHLDDNVILVKDSSDFSERYECLSAHLCGYRTENGNGSISNCMHNI